MARYITYPIVANARDLIQRSFTYMQAKITGWQPSEGQLDVWLLEATGNEGADIATLTTEVPTTIFRYFGANLFGIQPVDAVAATCTSTWFVTDNIGHTIPAGTQVMVPDSNNVQQPFLVLSDVIIPAGATKTADGEVYLIANVAGEAASNIGYIGGQIVLQDIISWVDHVTQYTVTVGGKDAELDEDYLTRLRLNLITMSPRPILPGDFAILARNVAGVQRAAAIDGYNPGDGSFNNERMITLVSVDSNGVGVSSPTRTAIQTYLDSMREINFVVHTTNPTSIAVDVTAHVSILRGYSKVDVQLRVSDAITRFLNPQYWGISPNDDPNNPKTWNNTTVIRYIDLAAAIKNVSGLDVVTELIFGLHGGALSTNDLTLTGVVPLPALSTLTVVAA